MLSDGRGYLVLSGDVGLMSIFNLFEFVLQTFQLNFHFLHKLQISLSPLVQDLDGLTHVLHLEITVTQYSCRCFHCNIIRKYSSCGVFIPSPAAVSAVWFEHLWNRSSAEEQLLYKHIDLQCPGLNCTPASPPQGLKDPPVTQEVRGHDHTTAEPV